MADQNPNNLPSRFAGFEAVPLRVTVRVGESRCRLSRLTELQDGDVVHLDRKVGEPFELMAGAVFLGHVEPVAEERGTAWKLVEIAEQGNAGGN